MGIDLKLYKPNLARTIPPNKSKNLLRMLILHGKYYTLME